MSDGAAQYDAEKEEFVTHMMRDLRLSEQMLGFRYLREAILYTDATQTRKIAGIGAHLEEIFQVPAANIWSDIRKMLRRQALLMTRVNSMRVITGATVRNPRPTEKRYFTASELILLICDALYLRR